MKNKTVIIIMICISILLFLLLVSIIIFNKRNSREVRKLIKFHYNYYGGMSTKYNVNYDIECSNKCIGNIKTKNNNYLDININDDTINKLINIINKNYIYKWNGFDKSLNATDGSGFNLQIVCDDNRKINAKGYMKFPKNHKILKEELNELFENIDENDYNIKTINYIDKFEIKLHSKNNNISEDKFYIDSNYEANLFNEVFSTEIDFSKFDFNDNVIFIKNINTGSGSNIFRLNRVIIKNGKVDFEIDKDIPKIGTADMAYWYIGAVVKFEDVMEYDLLDWKKPSEIKEK